MNCYLHKATEAIGTCSRCGKPICEACQTEIQGKNMCKTCVNIVMTEHENEQYNGEKKRITAALFAFFLGGLGAHKFYLGKAGLGVLYILFSWTFIPAIIALIEGIIYLTESDQDFYRKHVSR